MLFRSLQIAGSGGYLLSSETDATALRVINESIVRSGTTGFLLVLPTNSFDVYRHAIKLIKENPHPALLGLHLEGPYINPLRKGAHMKSHIRIPSIKEIEPLLDEAGELIKMITLAPEVCSGEFIEFLNDRGIIVAAGHSNATYNEAVLGFQRGIRAVTHLFNAMSQLHHRDPGLPGAVFQTDGISAAIIADGIHVDYNTIAIAKRLMKERLYLVSDAVEENLEGAYLHVKKEDRFTLPDGTLSGSLLTMLGAVRNCVMHAGIPVEEALRMATVYPAELINASGRGKISPGFKADLIVLSNDFELKHIFLNGKLI